MRTIKTKLLTFNNPKAEKNKKVGYYTGVLHLAPFNLGGWNCCPNATDGCAAACLHTAGNPLYFEQKFAARLRRKAFFKNHRADFIVQLKHEIKLAERRAKKYGMKLAIRLNGTSDINYARLYPAIFSDFPNVQFYDYTKSFRILDAAEDIPNYSVTFSHHEDRTIRQMLNMVKNGYNVAVVFDKVPAKFNNHVVVNGDAHDARFLEVSGSIIGLKAKGKARKDKSGFVIRT